MAEPQPEITALLRAWAAGDAAALTTLMPLVYNELHRRARRYMSAQKPGHTLQTTALVNEALLHLLHTEEPRWSDRAHFFAVSAKVMRRILIDAARARGADKRGGGFVNFHFNESLDAIAGRSRELLALDDALESLARFDPRKAQVIELRFFGGLSVEETATVLRISTQSVLRDWKLARQWLKIEMTAQA